MQLAAVQALATEAKKEPQLEGKDDEEKKDMDTDGTKGEATAAAPEGAAEEPEQFKLYRATLDPVAKQ
eukprot:15979405-Heterocapsa_arctica.AAC.1